MLCIFFSVCAENVCWVVMLFKIGPVNEPSFSLVIIRTGSIVCCCIYVMYAGYGEALHEIYIKAIWIILNSIWQAILCKFT